ncbi:MAG: hypothetical protein AAB470_01740 [Patescibacteria group bacterium]
MPPSEEKNRIEELKKSLYSRNTPDVRTRRKLRFTPSDSQVRTDWEHPKDEDLKPILNTHYEDHSMSFFTKLLIGSLIFCIVAVGIGAYIFYNGSNLISANNIDISISGPVSIPGGAIVSFDITVLNKNNVDLQGADLAIDFPAGTTDSKDSTQELKTFRELFGDIPAGGSARKTVSAIMFGEENLQKSIEVSVTYKIKGSSSLFTKKTSYDVLINSSPILLTASSFNEITSGQEFDMKVSLRSNSQDVLKNVLLKASYPFGFSFISADIKSLSDNATWKIGDIPPGGERIVTIRGKIQGEDNDTRVFRFIAGAQSSTDPKSIGTQYMSTDQIMTIQKPFISLGILIDGNDASSDFVSQFGRSERISVGWFNNLTTTVSNMVITVKLSGSAYEKTSVAPDVGYYNSATDEIIWSQQTNSDFASVDAGKSGTVSFSIIPTDKSTVTNPIVNPIITFTAGVAGNRTQESNVPSVLSSSVSRTTRVSSNVSLTGRVVRTIGPFTNTGPVPPKVEQPTTYTVVWTVDNTSSAVGGAKVIATLPPYVKWLNVVSPSSESVTYDENSGTVTWNIGNVSTYTIDSSRRREVNFQISFLPSVIQEGDNPTLVNQSILTATDSFTGAQLQSKQDYLSTRFSTDPNYKDGQGVVVK